ncbi:Response regulator rcp1 [Thalassocella blandensis]|nr:Response regulator rcp1 [Thalassocella blandensis]
MPNRTKYPILIIADDDLDDQLLIKDALEQNGVDQKSVTFVENGEDLLSILNNSTKELPSLILLDLNMPKKDGRETLIDLKKHERYKSIPVIIFSTSSIPEDIKVMYEHGANTFITKPSLYEDLVKTMGVVKSYWLEVSQLTNISS